jgi:aminopeptidase N
VEFDVYFHAGFYRVNYDVDNWMALIKQLREAPAEIHVLNRAQLIDDAFNLAGAGQLDYSVPLRLAEYLQNENNTLPWRSAMESFSNIIILKDNDRGYTSLMVNYRLQSSLMCVCVCVCGRNRRN